MTGVHWYNTERPENATRGICPNEQGGLVSVVKHKLSNVLLDIDERVSAFPGMYYRLEDAEGRAALAPWDDAVGGLRLTQRTDFTTYFGSCSLAKWKRYAQVNEVQLHIELSGGPCDIVLQEAAKGAVCPVEIARFASNETATDADDPTGGGKGPIVLDLAFPASDALLLSFAIEPHGETVLHEAHYFTLVDEAQVNPVRLALSTTTFKKEDYIIPNIGLISKEVLQSDEPIAEHFHMFVVDNGRTLDAEAVSGNGITVIPNANTGGAGGFARGMMAALDEDDSTEPFTHILLMDDDVVMSPESLKRTYNLLALAQGKYRDAFVNGAMLAIEQPNRKIEDVAHVLRTGGYRALMGGHDSLLVDDLAEVLESETVDVEVPNAYGAWWYSCIPMSVVREKGLPLPLFVRCDDVEYGVRAQGTYMTMSGICVWHEGFDDRFRPSVDCYQYVRNFLVMNAMDGCSSDAAFMQRIQRNMRFFLRTMYYDAVELFLDGIEDYMKGPEFLVHADGEQLMKSNGSRNEKLAPVDQLDSAIREALVLKPGYLSTEYETPLFVKLWRTLPYDRHLLPDALLRDKPVAMLYSLPGCLTPAAMATKTLVAMDQRGKNACVRRMDKERYRAIKKRWHAVMRDYRQRGDEVRASYKAAMPYLTSREFWERYLDMR